MANVIVFSSAFIRTASMALDEGTKRVRINMSSSWTKEIRSKMDWFEPDRPKGFDGRLLQEAANTLKLDGELEGRTLELKPNNKELAKAAIEFDISTVDHFELVTVSDGKSNKRELRFQVITTAAGALKRLEQYAEVVGQAGGELKISFVKQTELDMVDMTTEKQQKLQTDERAKATSAEED